MPARLSLAIYKGDELLETKEFERDIIKIGRLSSAHLRLTDEKVSRIHSVVEVNAAGEISIIDMGSAVGTLVNGERINKGSLKDGDEIQVGDTRIVLKVLSVSPATVDTTQEIQTLPPSGGAVPAAPAAAAPVSPAATPEAAPPPAVAAPTPAAPPPAPAAAPVPPPAAMVPLAPIVPAEGAALSPADEAPVGVALPPAEPVDPRAFVETKGPVPDVDAATIELRFLWGDVLLNVAHYRRPKQITIGESKKSHFFLASDDFNDIEEFPLIRAGAQGYRLTFTSKMGGVVRVGDKTMELKELVQTKAASPDPQIDGAFCISLPPDSRAALKFGGVTVFIRFVPPPKRLVIPWTQGIDYQFLNLFLFILFAHLALLITATNYPYDTDLIADDLFTSPNRFAKLILKPPEPVKSDFADKLLESLKKDAGEAAAKAKEEEGKMGRKKAPDRNTRSAPKAIDISAKDIIKSTGIFKMLKEGGSAGVSTVFGSGGLGGDLNGALGGLVGNAVGDARGMGGLGLKGTGSGGGGLSGSTFGVGGIGTKGRGGGLGGYGTGVGGLGKKKDSNINISEGTPIIMGSLDKELIRKVIRSHISQVRYCYERELQSKPGLYGKIAIKFVISATGGVTTAKIATTTMKNKNVEKCLISRVKSWQFPKPKGGGIVIVTYPFVFKQSG